MNLLTETLNALSTYSKTSNDVRWVGLKPSYYKHDRLTFYTDWKAFADIASFEYDDGYGGNEIDLRLIVVGDDWWLERHEYDGSEWWEFKTTPSKPGRYLAIINKNDIEEA